MTLSRSINIFCSDPTIAPRSLLAPRTQTCCLTIAQSDLGKQSYPGILKKFDIREPMVFLRMKKPG